MYDNEHISEQLEKLGSLLEILGENTFKVNAYYKAARVISSLSEPIHEILEDKSRGHVEGVGEAIRKKVTEISLTGTCEKLDELEKEIPAGVVEMLKIRGLGPKKIQGIWKEMGITTVGDLLYACHENRLIEQKGFGEKTQEKIRKAIEFLLQNESRFHYASLKPIADKIVQAFKKLIDKNEKVSLTGPIRRKMPVLESIEILLSHHSKSKLNKLDGDILEKISISENFADGFVKDTHIPIKIFFSDKEFQADLLLTTGSEKHLQEAGIRSEKMQGQTEIEIYHSLGLDFIEPELREGMGEVTLSKEHKLPPLVQLEDVKGCLHNHSTWSDGINSIEEMASACLKKGWQYFGISDHSKSAFYANGLSEGRIVEQHIEIEKLNTLLKDFRIFKGIESDILNDGRLDYSPEVLSSFDFVVASVHSQLSMDEEKATKRIIKAVENPYTSILGHPTGRLLLMREGYPLDHKKVIDACAANGVAIELNANPWRLDIDWTWIPYAMEKGVFISINPDAHQISGLNDVFWGIEAARKGRLSAEKTLNCMSLSEIDSWFQKKKG